MMILVLQNQPSIPRVLGFPGVDGKLSLEVSHRLQHSRETQ